MICKEGSNIDINSKEYQQQQQQLQQQQPPNLMTNSLPGNGFTTLQHRRKSQLITFSASSCDIKNSLSHDFIHSYTGGGGAGTRAGSGAGTGTGTVSTRASRANVRLSFAEEDVPLNTQPTSALEDDVYRHSSLLQVELGVEVGAEQLDEHDEDPEEEEEEEEDDDDDDEHIDVDVDVDVDVEVLYMHDEFETHIDAKSNNANDDSGGGSYEDSHALHSSLGGSNRNSLEKDDDDIDVDVISTDVSCYDQLLGSSSCNTRNGDGDGEDIATPIGDGDTYNKLSIKANLLGGIGAGGSSGAGGAGCIGSAALHNGATIEPGGNGSAGIIYANPFMDDEGIAESGM